MKSVLRDLYKELYSNSQKGKMDNLSDMALRLSQLVGKKPAWTAKYIRSVMAGNYQPSNKLMRAITVLASTLDEQSPLIALARPIKAYSVNGVEDESIVLGHSVRCKNCSILFVGRVYNQVYCSQDCKKKFRRLKNGKEKYN